MNGRPRPRVALGLRVGPVSMALALAIAGPPVLAQDVTRVPADPPRDGATAPVRHVDSWTLPGQPMDVVADAEGSGYLTLAEGGVVRFRLPADEGGELELRTVVPDLVQPRGLAIRDGVLYVVELGAFPCPPEVPLCEAFDAAGTPADGEVAIVDAMRGRVLAFDIAADGSLTGRRTILEDLPVVSALHAANGLELGPDGWLYLPVGNVDRLWWDPERVEGHTPHVDWLGTVLRLDGSGSAPEVVARGFRNVYEVAFEPDGRLWAVNNDGNAQAGFLLEELVQVKPGLDYGFPEEGTFGPRTARQEGPAWVMPTNGTAGLAWQGGVGLGPGLLVGDCGHLAQLVPVPTIQMERWEQALDPASYRVLLDGIAGCVTSIEPVAAEVAVAGVFGGAAGKLLAVRFGQEPPASGAPSPTPRTPWQPPG